MKTVEQIALRVLMVALLAVVGLVARPEVSLAQTAPSALQVVAQEGSSSSHFYENSELRTTNTTTTPLCANVYRYDTGGSLTDCNSYLVPPFGSLDDFCEGDCSFSLGEGSIFIVSGLPLPNTGVCSDTIVKPKAGLRSWLEIDDEGAVGVSAQDAVLGADVLRKLIGDCASF